MTLHFFTKGDDRLGDSRQRAFRIASELNARGIASVVHSPPVMLMSITPWPKKFFLIVATIRSLFSIKKGDIVFLQRTIGNKYFFVIMVAYLKLFRRKMIFDFDDAIYMHDPYKTKVFTRMADAVIVCSQALADWARPYNTNVHIIHTSLKFSEYAKFTKDYSVESKPVSIGWVGRAADHYKNLEFLATILKKLVARTPAPLTFRLIGAMRDERARRLFEGIAGLQVECIDHLEWNNPESVPREIQKFDIGVMPLVDRNEWNLARSSFKPFEYMACGVATVSSAVGEITHVIRNGVTGFLVDSADEWVETLTCLIADRELRAKIGRAGQRYVRENECYEAIIPRLIEIVKNIET